MAPLPVQLVSGDREVRAPAQVGGPKGQNNLVSGHTSLEQITRDTVFGPISLDPQLSSDDVDVHQAAVNTANSVSPDKHQQITITIAIEDGLKLNIPMRIGDFG